ncbi:DUF4388 domain-containing protein [Tengunoibacter tsumagoiensis]|uniref:PatA-like N-terminal domain-containing protein n=1 Tax=Tengunoibacter tsumagoiensis TaxID=2014871 RepID=A0A401ZXU3_9CHLR|nr:DUF4388 domain-containing protein [Tengunoibacter tsumagoiensis]GCE11653.1 hypothetical protein KTT_15120 [Tengunoibacter tsumagoiensis]
MSLIGTLDQFSLSNVLQRIEAHQKTGLLVVRQGAQWVEFYLRDGRLLCIGPVRTSATLGERLMHDGVISPTVFQETLLVIGNADLSETRFALTLMELGYVSRDELRNWAISKAVDVLQALLPWSSGDIYFDEGLPAPTDRLLASMEVSVLIASAEQLMAQLKMQAEIARPIPPTSPLPAPATYSTLTSQIIQEPPITPQPVKPATHVSRVPTLMGASQFLDESAFVPPIMATSLPTTEPIYESLLNDEPFITPFEEQSGESGFPSFLGGESGLGTGPSAPSLQPMPVMNPVPPRRIDTSFMRPDMVLIPIDLSAFREQNPQIQVTPDQWRILTRVDGKTTLQMACQELSMLPELVCQVAGELMAEGLIYVSLPDQLPMNEPTPLVRDVSGLGLSANYVAPGYAAAAASPWSASVPPLPAPDAAPQFPSSLPFETQSQWGNGGNGATFIPGRGWITTPQPMQPLPSGPLAPQNGIYAPMGGNGNNGY